MATIRRNCRRRSPVRWRAAPSIFGRSSGLFCIENRSSRVLNLVVLDFQPDWGITQVLPAEGEGSFFPLDSGNVFLLPLQAHLPRGLDQGTDRLKVFATVRTADFHWLEQPPLGRLVAGGPVSSDETPSLPEERLGSLRSNAQRSFSLLPSEFSYKEWVTAEVEVRVRRPSH